MIFCLPFGFPVLCGVESPHVLVGDIQDSVLDPNEVESTLAVMGHSWALPLLLIQPNAEDQHCLNDLNKLVLVELSNYVGGTAHFFQVLQMWVRERNPRGAPYRAGKPMGITVLLRHWVSVRLRPGRVKLLCWLLATWTSFTALHDTVQKQFVSHYTLYRELINPF